MNQQICIWGSDRNEEKGKEGEIKIGRSAASTCALDSDWRSRFLSRSMGGRREEDARPGKAHRRQFTFHLPARCYLYRQSLSGPNKTIGTVRKPN